MESEIHKGHRERLRKKFLEHGIECLEDHEVLELILFFSLKRGDTNPIGHALLDTFGSLQAVLDASYEDLKKCPKVGAHSATLIKLFQGVAKRYLLPTEKTVRILTSKAAAEYAIAMLQGAPNETLYLLCLNMKYQLIHKERVTEGTIDSVPIYPRRIAEICLRHGASRIILAHNHPTGNPTPSRRDIETTMEIVRALGPLGIVLCDHIIVSGAEYYSFNDRQQNTGFQEGADVDTLKAAQYDYYDKKDE